MAMKLSAVLCVALNRQASGFQFRGPYRTSDMALSNRYVTACSQQRQFFGRHRRSSSSSTHRTSHREGFVLQRGGLHLRRLLLYKSWLRLVGKQPVSGAILVKEPRGTPQLPQQQSLRPQQSREEGLARSGALVALPLLGRLFAQANNLFQVGVLFGTVPTLLAGLVCCYWAWQVSNTEYC